MSSYATQCNAIQRNATQRNAKCGGTPRLRRADRAIRRSNGAHSSDQGRSVGIAGICACTGWPSSIASHAATYAFSDCIWLPHPMHAAEFGPDLPRCARGRKPAPALSTLLTAPMPGPRVSGLGPRASARTGAGVGAGAGGSGPAASQPAILSARHPDILS
jgi:hypothetical protein